MTAAREAIGSDLYLSMLAFDYADQERADLMHYVWSVTPWIIDCYTGSINDERMREMRGWLRENMGPQAFPIHGKAGDWQYGSATIQGWTWVGFATEEQLSRFVERFHLGGLSPVPRASTKGGA